MSFLKRSMNLELKVPQKGRCIDLHKHSSGFYQKYYPSSSDGQLDQELCYFLNVQVFFNQKFCFFEKATNF